MAKDTRIRPWLKKRLPDNKDTPQAIRIVDRWTAARVASVNIVRAIRVYDAILRGDRELLNKLLREYLPGYGFSFDGSTQSIQEPPIETRPLPHAPDRPRPSKPMSKPKIVVSDEAHDQSNEDEDDIGFSSLDLGIKK